MPMVLSYRGLVHTFVFGDLTLDKDNGIFTLLLLFFDPKVEMTSLLYDIFMKTPGHKSEPASVEEECGKLPVVPESGRDLFAFFVGLPLIISQDADIGTSIDIASTSADMNGLHLINSDLRQLSSTCDDSVVLAEKK